MCAGKHNKNNPTAAILPTIPAKGNWADRKWADKEAGKPSSCSNYTGRQ